MGKNDGLSDSKSNSKIAWSFMSYLEQDASLPLDLLKISAKYHSQNPTTPRANALPDMDVVRLRRICSRESSASFETILNNIRRERHRLQSLRFRGEKNFPRKILDWLGSNWRITLEGFRGQELASCPKCSMLIDKVGGCKNVYCVPPCCSVFDWRKRRVDWPSVIQTCHLLEDPREMFACKRVLELAERTIMCAIDSQKKNRMRKKGPRLQVENCLEIIDDIKKLSMIRDSNDDGLEDRFSEDQGDRRKCQSSSSVVEWDSSVSFPSLTTNGSSRCTVDNVSVMSWTLYSEEYSLSGWCRHPNDRDCIVITKDMEDRHEDSDANLWSVLSGCETVHSLENFDAVWEGQVMSYCTALKVGLSKGFRCRNTDSVVSTNTTPTLARYRNDAYHNYDKDNDFSLSFLDAMRLYDGVKSGHGGKESLRFRGNRPTPRTFMGNYLRRPNWSRKRRKGKKSERLGQTKRPNREKLI